jgi:tetratricopeptide (TPR) repeat protein
MAGVAKTDVPDLSKGEKKMSVWMRPYLFSLVVLFSLLLTGCAADNGVLEVLRGNNLRELGKHEQAIQAYNDAISIDPQLAEAYYNRGMVYTLRAEYDKAIADFDSAIELKPEWAEAYGERAMAHRSLGDEEQADDDAEQAVALSPDFATPYERRIGLCDFWDDGSLGLLRYDARIASNPEDAEAYFCRAMLYMTMYAWEMGIQDLDRVIELRPDDAEAYFSRALVSTQFVDMSDSDAVMRMQKDLDKAIELAPDFAFPYAIRGVLQMGSPVNASAAIQDFEMYLDLAPDTGLYTEITPVVKELLNQTNGQEASSP